MKKNRVEYLDFLKGNCIFLVVFCHYCMLPGDTVFGNIVMCAAWGAVPCFFLASGGLMHGSAEWNWKKYAKKVIRIYSVLCIWKAIYFVIYYLNGGINCSKAALAEYLFFFGRIENINADVMWFMEAYLLVMLFWPVSRFLFQGAKAGRQVLSFVIGILFVNEYLIPAINFALLHSIAKISGSVPQISFQSVVPFNNYGNMLFFFLAGAFLFEYREKITVYLEKRKWIPWIFTAAGIFLLMFVKYIENGIWTWGGIYIENGYGRIAVVLLAAGLYASALLTRENRVTLWVAAWIGTNTQGIYYMHYIALAMFSAHYAYLYESVMSFTANVIKTIVTLLICVIVSVMIKKIPLLRYLV